MICGVGDTYSCVQCKFDLNTYTDLVGILTTKILVIYRRNYGVLLVREDTNQGSGDTNQGISVNLTAKVDVKKPKPNWSCFNMLLTLKMKLLAGIYVLLITCSLN